MSSSDAGFKGNIMWIGITNNRDWYWRLTRIMMSRSCVVFGEYLQHTSVSLLQNKLLLSCIWEITF